MIVWIVFLYESCSVGGLNKCCPLTSVKFMHEYVQHTLDVGKGCLTMGSVRRGGREMGKGKEWEEGLEEAIGESSQVNLGYNTVIVENVDHSK